MAAVLNCLLEKMIGVLEKMIFGAIAKELEDLDTSLLLEIQLIIQAWQHSPPNHKAQLARWLERLKEAYCDDEDILDELKYDRLRRKVKHKIQGEDRKLSVRLSSKPIIKPLAKFTDPAVKRSSLLLDRLKKLMKIAEEAKTFHDQNTESKKDTIITGSVTSSFLIDKVFGRDGDRDEIINFLLDKQGGSSLKNSYSVVAVTGIGGVGKTTLAQYVYNDERVKNHFGVRMWLCISQKFDVTDLIKEMIECASGEECPNLSSLDVLLDKLIETLPKSDNIMIVLDDVWYERETGENQWDKLLSPFNYIASQGGTCKIVVTSRSTSFPFALLPGKLIELSDLAPNDFISLLRYHAIDGLEINDPQLKNDLSDIVDQIRLSVPLAPLAAKVVGNQLRERPDIEFWQVTLGNVNLSTDGVIAGNSRSITSSLLPDKVFGHDGDHDKIINFLLDDEDHDGGGSSRCYIVAQNIKPYQTIQARYWLNFINKVKNPTFTTDLVRDENGDPIRVTIYDSYTQSTVSPDFRSSAKVRITVLDAEFSRNKGVTWSRSEFIQSVLRGREGKGPILTGRSLTIQLENGVGTFENIVFNDNSSWTKSGFRLGVMVEVDGEEGYLNGERVGEGVSEPFQVKDLRGKGKE